MPSTESKLTSADLTTRNVVFEITIPADHRNDCLGWEYLTFRADQHSGNGQYRPATFVRARGSGIGWIYVGKLNHFTGQVETTAASNLEADHPALVLLNRMLARVWGDDYAAFERHGFRLAEVLPAASRLPTMAESMAEYGSGGD